MTSVPLNSDETEGDQEPTAGRFASRGPVLDRISAIVACTGLLLLATNDAPPLADLGTTAVVVACVGLGTLAGLVLYQLFGTVVRGPLWIGVVTAAVLFLPVLLVLLVTGTYTATLGWAISLSCTAFGLGATVRSMQAYVGSSGR